MSCSFRRIILFADGLFLLVAGTGGAVSDIAASALRRGPMAEMMETLPAAGIGFLEAHGLAVIIGVMLLLASGRPSTRQHLAGAATHLVLGGCNLAFWDVVFVSHHLETVGWVTTVLHVTFVVLQLLAVLSKPSSQSYETASLMGRA